jgi:3-hydroxyisobutyrate dehydrogenase
MPELGRFLFIGLGAMGSPMVRNLAKAGADIVVNDADPERADAVAQEISAKAVKDARDVAADVDVVVLMLPNSTIVRDVLESSAGGPSLLQSLSSGALVIDMGSSQPDVTIELATAAAERGVAFVDAPVSGGVARAVTGELAIMVGGEEAAVARALPVLETMGGTIVPTGGVGTAHAMKALNNLLSATGLAAASEVMVVGQKFGLDPHTMLEVLNASSGRNHATEVKAAQFILSRAFNAGFSMDLMVKDLGIAIGLAESVGASTPISAAVVETWRGAQSLLADPKADHTEVARFIERASQTELH